MKHNFRRLIAFVLVICMICPMALNASAAGWNNSSRNETNGGLGSLFGSLLEDLFGDLWGNLRGGSTQQPNDEPGMMLALVEDQDTVSDDVVMRASVYEADANDPVAQAELQGSNVVYYPSTFIDYDDATINQSMANLEVQYAVDNGLSTSSNGWVWKGIYFGAGGSTEGRNDRESSRTGRVGEYRSTSVQYSTVRNSSSYYYLAADGNYYQVTCTRSGSYTNYRYTLTYKDAKGTTQTLVNSAANAYITLYTYNTTTSVTSSNYAPWVKWGLNDTGANGSYIHSGMTTGKLVNGVPEFVAPYASRLFDDSVVNGKTRYTNVGLPFIYEKDENDVLYYTFDSSYNGAYFPNGGESDVNLTLLDAPIVLSAYKRVNNRWVENKYTCFMPFNKPNATAQSTDIVQTDGTEIEDYSAYHLPNSGTNTNNFFFSMITSVPFTMTENGKMNPSDDESEPIKFEFSGDDDVWVFVDDTLVLDLGGIHDPVSGKIDFAANEVTFWTCASNMPVGDATETYGPVTDGEPISQGAIFTMDGTVGKLNMDRATFAASDNHTLTIVYLERGSNMSNNKIRFNLPQKDYIAVSKHIDEKLYKQTDETVEDGYITDELFATLNQRNFTYVLYENGVAMTGVRFSRYDANGNFVGNGSTASDGTFNVKNGETVRFYDVDFNGENEYYVVELDPDAGSNNNAWGDVSWAHNTMVANGFTEKDESGFASQKVTATGSTEAVDTIFFTNTNKLLSPVADIANDNYVIDFGLPVELNPLANDTYSATGETLVLAGISQAAPTEDNPDPFGTAAITGTYGTLTISNGKLIYTLHSQMTGRDVFYYQVGLSTTDELEGVYGTITIMPATTMYYEESFEGLSLTGDWTDVGTAQGGYQEEGRVGTTTDSPYGSDKVYKENTGDSYGTSKYINTSDKGKIFSFTFTGTGAALYARTSDKSAYMIITVKDQEGNVVGEQWRRNTIYKPVEDTQLKDNTLYNIPVYVADVGAYGTYTVEVKLNKAMVDAWQDENGNWHDYKDKYVRGCDFYLDGIRVYNPANAYTGESTSPAITQIEDAYARDGEAYITVDSLRNKLLLDYTKYDFVYDENGEIIVDENGDPVFDISWDGVNYVVFTDVNGEIRDAETYQSAGPKEEVYMKDGQSVTFSLDNWDQNRNKVYLGIKAPAGSGFVRVNNERIAINNTTDIYYDITNYATVSGGVATFKITADSALISVTTIKVTGTADFTIVSRGPVYPEFPEEDIPEDVE